MTSQKLLDEARKQAQEITNWFHVKASPDNDPRAIEHLAIRLAEFAASCLAEKEKEIAELKLERDEWDRKENSWKHAAIKQQSRADSLESTLTAREEEIERLKGELASENKVAQLEIARAESAERELAEIKGKG